MKINEFISTIMLIALLLIATLGGITQAENEEDWMPDPNLRQAVREGLGIPDAIPMTPADMAELYALVKEYDIKSLRGLEHAINLKFLHIGRSEVSDITLLAGLKNLRELKLFGNRISDITPLAGLINLEVLELQDNQIVDISPLKRLMNLKVLKLGENQIVDISPLSNLTALTYLHIGTNQIVDFTPLLNLTNLESLGILNNPNSEAGQFVSADPAIIEAFRVTICDFESPTYVRSIKERIESREYPSAFLTHKRGNDSEQYPDTFNQFVRYDFSFMFEPFHPFVFSRTFHSPFGGKVRTTNDQRLLEVHRDAIRENPNMIFIVEIAYFDGRFLNLPDDSPYWFRNKDGSIAIREWSVDSFGNEQVERLVNFTHPDVIEMIIQQTVAIAKCGLYDGIWLDRWHPDFHGELSSLVTPEDELNARLQILQGIRANVRDDFLIMVNSREEIPHFAPYINGIFIEAHEPNPNYTHKDLYHFENIIKWYESNLREPSFTLLWGQAAHKPPRSQRVMRLFTTLSLTHSDGYVSVSSEPHPLRTYYYDFWDANLGRPMGEKAELYNSIDGLFIREFTSGWAVYNRSGKEQTIEFSEEVSGVASGVKDKRSHTLPDLDGEIYLKIPVQVAPGKYPPLYWINAKTGTLQRLVDTEVKNLVSRVQNATSLTVDTTNGKLYWTEQTGNRTGKIRSANLDGNPNVQIVRELTSAPLDIALDIANGKLYLSNAWGKIQRMNLDGSNFQPNLITDLKAPQHLVLDTTSGQLYWTEQTAKTTGRIQRANLDGSNVQLVKELTSAPRGMALDAVNRKLYLTNGWGKLQRMNLNGSNFESNLITGLMSPGQVVVDRVGGNVYWTEQGKLRRADLNGENIQDVVTGLGDLTDLGLGIDSAGEMDIAAAPAAITTVVEQTQLLANYPNPFNPETWIPYQLSEPTEVTVRIYSVNGILIRTLALGQTPAGIYQDRSRAAYWDGRNDVGESVASGLYFYTLTAGDFTATRKMLIRK